MKKLARSIKFLKKEVRIDEETFFVESSSKPSLSFCVRSLWWKFNSIQSAIE
jgi:hypothetical protein